MPRVTIDRATLSPELATAIVSDAGPQATVETPPEWLLYHGIRNLLRCDDAAIVSSLADYVFSQHRSLRLLSMLVEGTRRLGIPSFITLLGGLRAFLLVRPPAHREGVLWIARLENERRELEAIPMLVPELLWSEVKLSWRVAPRDVVSLAVTFGATVGRIMRISRRLHHRVASFKVLRVAELLGYYLRYLQIFENGRYALAVMSSHSNPHAVALNLAARRFGIPVVLVTHGMPVRPVARLSYDLGVVHCVDARRTYADEGCRIRHVLVHGRRQLYHPMRMPPAKASLTVGIFLCKDVNADRLRSLVAELLASPRVVEILIRPHPFNLWRELLPWVESLAGTRVRLGAGDSVASDLADVDIVLAGNSSVHIDALVAGRPATYVPGLDHGGNDLHGFVARRLVYPMDERIAFVPDEIVRFYGRGTWLPALREFANIDEDAATIGTQAASIMRELVARHQSRVADPRP